MRKNRNSFFAESSFESYNPNMNMGSVNPSMPNQPYQSASNCFYQGPMPNNYNTNGMNNDIESRLAKIERQINRMDYRLSKLENANNIIKTENFDTNSTTTNMYML